MKIAFCQITYWRDWEKTLGHIEILKKFDTIDYIVIVVDHTVPKAEIENVLKSYDGKPKLIIYQTEFKDNLPMFRNEYVRICRELGVTWFIVSDPDEWICEDLFRDIRKIIDWAEEHGYNQLGINCREKFQDIEWLSADQLDMLKEYPGGYRESTYYKFLINKICCEHFRYEGVGKTKNVHETWYCPYHPRRGAYLPKEKYWYVHEKSAYDIWRNAARNMFISGGGDNVGDINEMWVELRRIVKEDLGIDSWTEFESYIISGKSLPERLVRWVKRALTWKATDYGIETRQMAKWIIYHHRYLLQDPEIRYGVEHPPKLTPEDEVENYVRRCYFQVLGRHPDRDGLEYWKRMILEGKIRKEDLPNILRQSPEYMEKHILTAPVNLPVDVRVNLSKDDIVAMIMRHPAWFTEIKPALDLGKFILTRIRDQEEFIRWFYSNKHSLDLRKLLEKLGEHI